MSSRPSRSAPAPSPSTAARGARSAPRAAPPDAVGVIGLGIMGSSISANLVKAGFTVHGTDPVAKARTRLKKSGGRPWGSLSELAAQCRWIVASLPDEAALESVCEELARSGQRGTVVAETSTLPETAKARARDHLAKAGIILLDCPLSGTGAQAITGDLAVYASGDARAIAGMAAVFAGFARVRYDVGDFGNGMRMKLVANLLVAIHNVSAAEAIALGVRSGLDATQIVEVVADGAGGSRMLQVRGPLMAARTWTETVTMKVSTWQKDMRLIAQALAATGTPAPLFAATEPVYNAAIGLGHGSHDTASVYSVLEHMMGAAAPVKAARKRKVAPAKKPQRGRAGRVGGSNRASGA